MRKLKLEVQLSIDGFAADKDGEMDWMVWNWAPTWNWDKPLRDFHTQLQTSSDTVLLGKRMAAGNFYPHWETIAKNRKSPQYEFANAILNMKAYVFSKTLKKAPREDVELVKGDLKTEVEFLKKQKGKDMIAYGGTRFVASLIKEDLVDEYNLLINPTILGKGKPIYQSISSLKTLSLVDAIPFKCGVVLLRYKKKA